MSNEPDTTNPTPDPKPGKQQQAAPEPAAMFSQADVDRIIGERAKRAGESAINQLLEGLGVESADALKSFVTKAKEKEEGEKSELQKLQEQIAKLEKDRDTEKQRAAQIEAARLTDKINTKLEGFATKAKAANPEDVVDYLRNRHSDEVAALAGEGGVVDEKAAEKLIEIVRKARPNWFAVQGPGSPSNHDGRPPQPDDKKLFGDKPLVRW